MSSGKQPAQRPDVEDLLSPLKGFQRKTVDYVFRRMYLDDDPAYRFLVADEVGLGKTLIARGIVAKAIDHLWEKVERIDVVYICSNIAIAQQNLKKLAIGEAKNHALATRLTLLPQELQGLAEHKLNFVSFTPATSFDLKSKGGRVDERRLLYWLLAEVRDDHTPLKNLLQGRRGYERWREDVSPGNRPALDRTLADAFHKGMQSPEAAKLRQQLDEACHLFRRRRDPWPSEHVQKQRGVVGELRMLLARSCIEKLEPDLIILDEFQRFRHLLQGGDEMSELAKSLWSYITPENMRARVLLLSATPYRMYSTDGEIGDDDHYPDFLRTTRFLMDNKEDRVQRFEGRLRTYRRAIHSALNGDPSSVREARKVAQSELQKIMVRTERVAATEDRAAMISDSKWDAPLEPTDLRQWLFVDDLGHTIDARDAMELWKSAPYLPHFMRGYQFKKKLEAQQDTPEVAAVVRKHDDALLRRRTIQSYKELDPANARMRALARELLDGGREQLLWIPPTIPYWALGDIYAKHQEMTKALVFSAWNVVPDVISAVLSYEAERRMLDGQSGVKYQTLHREHRGLLLFKVSDDRPTGMPVLALQYPSLTLADEIVPLSHHAQGEDARTAARSRIESLLEELRPLSTPGRSDERWYWAAPALLDNARGIGKEFLHDWAIIQPESEHAKGLDATKAKGDDTRFTDHVALLRAVIDRQEPLGAMPDDLAEVLTEIALGAPGILAARSLLPIHAAPLQRQRAAAIVAEGLRTLFNQPTAMAVARRHGGDVPYWRATLRYAIDGCLQAVLDEHFHQLWEQEAWAAPDPAKAIHRIAHAMGNAASIKISRVAVDTFNARGGQVALTPMNLRTSFALRYGRVIGDKDTLIAREGAVRAAFNSPYRPFVLASTSIGQEGLDFHPWCHSIVHWNLPGNPVDLEQREGRVHRYKGHAVRRNVAAQWSAAALRAHWKPGKDPWTLIFDAAAQARPHGARDLNPWWVCEGPYKVQRRIPMLPFSREVERLTRLKRDLVAYRLAFGQPRQQELLELVHGAEVTPEALDEWTLDLGV